MTEYLITIYNDPSAVPPSGTVEPSHLEFLERHQSSLRGGAALEGPETATTIRDGVITDGLFAETKEVLGGYYVVEAADLDAALAIARDVPIFGSGGVEVRPIWVRS